MATYTANIAISLVQEDGTTILVDDIAISGANASANFTYKEEKQVDLQNGTDNRLLTMGTDESGGQQNIKLAIIQNLHASSDMRLKICDTGGDTIYLKIPAGQAHLISSDDIEIQASEGAFSAYSNADTVYGQLDGDTGKARVISIGT